MGASPPSPVLAAQSGPQGARLRGQYQVRPPWFVEEPRRRGPVPGPRVGAPGYPPSPRAVGSPPSPAARLSPRVGAPPRPLGAPQPKPAPPASASYRAAPVLIGPGHAGMQIGAATVELPRAYRVFEQQHAREMEQLKQSIEQAQARALGDEPRRGGSGASRGRGAVPSLSRRPF